MLSLGHDATADVNSCCVAAVVFVSLSFTYSVSSVININICPSRLISNFMLPTVKVIGIMKWIVTCARMGMDKTTKQTNKNSVFHSYESIRWAWPASTTAIYFFHFLWPLHLLKCIWFGRAAMDAVRIKMYGEKNTTKTSSHNSCPSGLVVTRVATIPLQSICKPFLLDGLSPLVREQTRALAHALARDTTSAIKFKLI